jgi:hypothetical protein
MTLETLIGLSLDEGPLSARYGGWLGERALECFAANELTFVAFVASPEGLGGTVDYTVAPAWLETWDRSGADRYLAASDLEAAPGAPNGPFLPVAVPPELRPAFDALRGRWVTVSGQFDAPAARACVLATEGATGARIPTRTDLVDMCRTSFVLRTVKPAADPCPTGNGLAVVIATPEQLRADCFGGRQLAFDAVGWPINNIWPGMVLPSELDYGDWVLALAGKTEGLWVFVPASVNSSGIYDVYPQTVRWRVSGHFDDPLADSCRPSAGDTMDGVPIVRSLGEVRAFCRNHLVVDRLARL